MNYAVAEPATRSSCMKSQGEIEAAVCDGISRFQQNSLGAVRETSIRTSSAISSSCDSKGCSHLRSGN